MCPIVIQPIGREMCLFYRAAGVAVAATDVAAASASMRW